MEKYQRHIPSDALAAKTAIMRGATSILEAKKNEPGVFYGDASEDARGGYALTLHMGGTLFRIQYRPQLRAWLRPERDGCALTAEIAKPWLDWIFLLLLTATSLVASVSFFVARDTLKGVFFAAGFLLFAFTFFSSFSRARYEAAALLDYLDEALQAPPTRD